MASIRRWRTPRADASIDSGCASGRPAIALIDMPPILSSMKMPHALFTIIVLGVLAYAMVRVQPSRHIRIAAGPIGGSFYESAQQYQRLMAPMGYSVTIVPLDDTDEIGAKLSDRHGQFDIGFVADDSEGRRDEQWTSLGDIQLQSVFIFVNRRTAAARAVHSFADLRGMTLVMPPQRSLTARTFLRILATCGVQTHDANIAFLPMNDAIGRLRQGQFDAGLFILGADSALMADLAKDPNLLMVEIDQRDAIAKKLPYLTQATLPAGIYDLTHNVPARDMGMLALTISVAARPGLPAATTYAVLAAMREAHHKSSYLNTTGAFPRPSGAARDVDARVDGFYRSGVPWIFAHLPLALASVVDAYLGPLVALLFLTNAFKVMTEVQQIRLFVKVAAARLVLWWVRRRIGLSGARGRHMHTVLESLATSIEREDGSVRELLGALKQAARVAGAPNASRASDA